MATHKAPIGDRITAFAVDYWLSKGLSEWPTVGQITKRLRVSQKAVQEAVDDNDRLMVTQWNVAPPSPFREHSVEVMNDPRVDAAWQKYWEAV